MKDRADIDCLGLGIMPFDLLYTVDSLPEVEMKIDALSLYMQGGGPVPTALIGLARLGKKTAMIGTVGDDPVGQLGIGELNGAGVDTRFVKAKKNKISAVATGWVEKGSGRRTMVLGRDIFVRPKDFNLTTLPRPRVVHLDGRDMEATIKLARWAKRVGAIVSFDIGSIRNDVSAAFKYVDHLVVADSYAFPFTGTRQVRKAIDALGKYGPQTVVITEGIRGSTGLENGALSYQPAFKVAAVDTTGAGDAFHAGYLFGLLDGLSLARRLRIGAATAALKCLKPGARTGLPNSMELLRYLRANPVTYPQKANAR